MKQTKINIEGNTLFVYRATVPDVKRGGETTDPTTSTITFTTTTHILKG